MMRAKRRDPIAIVEAAYRLDGTDEDWLRGVRDAARPELDAGFGVAACLFDLQRGGWREARLLTDGCHEALHGGFRASVQDPDWERQALPLMMERPLFYGALSQFGRQFRPLRPWREHLLPHGIRDMLSIVVMNPSGPSCGLNTALPHVARLSAPTIERWGRVAAHLAAGLRVRRLLTDGSARSGDLEAILAPDGACVHVERAAASEKARTQLRRSARALDRARGRLRRTDPDAALAIWRGLCAGRWSLVDHVDRDGRRFLLARRNDPEVAPHDGLTLEERQVAAYVALGHANKLIAYELGLAESTVAMRITRAARKLGARNRVDLVRRLRARLFGSPAPPAGT